jgi:hypothetical protein
MYIICFLIVIWNRCMFMRLDVNESYRFHLICLFKYNCKFTGFLREIFVKKIKKIDINNKSSEFYTNFA